MARSEVQRRLICAEVEALAARRNGNADLELIWLAAVRALRAYAARLP
jgi:hypothetical protein